MKSSKTSIRKQIIDYVKSYTQMNIHGVVVNCPYWANKLKKNKVVFRGFLDGKGSSSLIKDELIKGFPYC